MSNLTYSLINGWSNHGGNELFRVDVINGEVQIVGLVVIGSNGVFMQLPVQLRPADNIRFALIGDSSGTKVVLSCVVATTGDVAVENYTAAPSWISLRGIRFTIP